MTNFVGWTRTAVFAGLLAGLGFGCGANAPTAPSLMNIVVVGPDRIPGVGQSLQLMVIATFSDDGQQDQTAAAVWNSSKPAVATVSHGLVSALAEGTTDIVASFQGAVLSKPIRVEVTKPAVPAVSASVTVTTSPDVTYPWRAHLQVTYSERGGSGGFRVETAQIDYRDINNQSRFGRVLGPGDFQQAWGVNRVEPGESRVLGRQLDFTGTDSAMTALISTTVVDDLGNSVTLTTSATGRSALAGPAQDNGRAAPFLERPAR